MSKMLTSRFGLILTLLFNIGCRRTLGKWKREISILPASSPQEIDVKFRILYSPNLLKTRFGESYMNQSVYAYNAGMDQMKSLPLDASKKTIFLFHGWLDTLDSSRFWWDPIVESVKRIKPYDYQVIFVDWSHGSSSSFYLPAVSNLRVAADMIASNIRTLIEDLSFDSQKIRLIGFSLGAHLAGFTGKLLTGRRKVAWITGLEPANAMFELSSPEGSLFQSDAHYVDIIHSASGNIFQGFSKPQALGHRDYYINGAMIPQPGCNNEMPFGAVGGFFSTRRPCSHDRAPLVFSRSKDTDSCSSIAFECSSYDDFLGGFCSRTCSPGAADKDDSGCVWFGFSNDLLHRDSWPPTPPLNRDFQTLFLQSNGMNSCLLYYRLDVKTGKTDNPSTGTFTVKVQELVDEVKMKRNFLSFRSHIMLMTVKKPLDCTRQISLTWESGRSFLGSLLPIIPLFHSSNGNIHVQGLSLEYLNPPDNYLRETNQSLVYPFCGLHSRQEIKSGSRLILERC